MSWSEEIIEFAPYCVRLHRHPEENALLEVLDDWWEEETMTQMVEIRVVNTGVLIKRSFDWVKMNCRTLNEMEVLAWISR